MSNLRNRPKNRSLPARINDNRTVFLHRTHYSQLCKSAHTREATFEILIKNDTCFIVSLVFLVSKSAC